MTPLVYRIYCFSEILKDQSVKWIVKKKKKLFLKILFPIYETFNFTLLSLYMFRKFRIDPDSAVQGS